MPLGLCLNHIKKALRNFLKDLTRITRRVLIPSSARLMETKAKQFISPHAMSALHCSANVIVTSWSCGNLSLIPFNPSSCT